MQRGIWKNARFPLLTVGFRALIGLECLVQAAAVVAT
jgi:hypothetical protein